MFNEIIVEVANLVVRAVFIALSGFVLTWIKGKIGVENYNKATNVAEVTVKAIEQEIGAGKGAEKKEKVMEILYSKLGHRFEYAELENLVEAAVFEMNNQYHKIKNG